MNIAQALPPVDRDAVAPAANGAHARKGEALGDAFERAVRKAGAPADRKAAEDDEAATDEAADLSDGEDAATPADAGAPAATSPADALVRLLGALGSAQAAAAGRPADSVSTVETPGAAPDGVLPTALQVEGSAVASDGWAADAMDGLNRIAALVGASAPDGGEKPAIRLDILGLETHFEPRSDDFVLVDGRAAAAEGIAAASVDARASGDALAFGDALPLSSPPESPAARQAASRAAAAAAGGLSAKPAVEPVAATPWIPRSASRGSAPEDRAAPAPASVEDAEPRLRFGEALARLGRGGASDGPGGGGARDSGGTGADGRRAPAAVGDLAASAADKGGAAFVPSVSAQVAERIVGVLGAPGGGGATRPGDTSAAEPFLRLRAGGAALKTLTIQLQPEDLGTLEVSMRLVDGKLSLELSASRHATARMLSEDRGSLRKLLEQAGFSLDDAAISVLAKDASTLLSARGAANGGSSTSGEGTAGGQGGGGGARPEAGGGQPSSGRGGDNLGREARRERGRQSPDEGSAAARRPATSVYL